MMRLVLITGLLAASSLLAHQGVQNPTVMQRMSVMSDISSQTKVLGQMVQGAVPFDAGAARAAKAALIRHAGQVGPSFILPETDPKSEALPTIWQDADGFARAVAEFVSATAGLDVSTKETLAGSFKAFGATCSGCHKTYRK